MDMSMFLAQVWGPIILAFGVGVFLNKKHYSRVYADLQREPMAMVTFGIVAMALGIWQLSVHNLWETMLQIVVSLLSWGLLLKGTIFVVFPGFVDKMGDWQVKSQLVGISGALCLIVGGYFTWVSYLA